MSLFDKYSKLRKAISVGAVHSDREVILKFLVGELTKEDLPTLVIEPASAEELRIALNFASEKGMKVAVSSGLKPVEIRGLGGQMLILTKRLNGSPPVRNTSRVLRVDAGLSAEALAIDLTRENLRWLPLFPPPAGESVGSLIATAWEGLRNFRDGGILSYVRAIEWMGYDGVQYGTGSATTDAQPVDVSGFLFGSQGAMGIITAVEIELEPMPAERTGLLISLPDANAAGEMLSQLRRTSPVPETVVYYGETATQILRQANDGTIPEDAKVLLMIEWREQLELPEEWTKFGVLCKGAVEINALWQDLFRLTRATARLHPYRCEARLRLSTEGLADLEERAHDLSHEYNMGILLWGTADVGCVNLAVLQPDNEPRTTRQAEDLLEKLLEDGMRLGGVPLGVLPRAFVRRQELRRADLEPATTLKNLLLTRCDRNGMHAELKSKS